MSDKALYAVLSDFEGMAEKEVTPILEKYNYITFSENVVRSANHRIFDADLYIVAKPFKHEDADYNIGDYWTCTNYMTVLGDDEA